jgi:hypothetical protein
MSFPATPLHLLLQSYRLYREQGAFYVGYAAWLLLPVVALLALSFFPFEENIAFILALLLSVAEGLLSLYITIFLFLVTDKRLGHIEESHQELLLRSRTLLKPVILVALLQAVIVLGGLILFLIPGLIFLVWFSFAQSAVILDRQRGFNALAFSRAAVRGRFWHAVWFVLAGPLFLFCGYALLSSLVISLVALFTQTDPSVWTQTPIHLWIEALDAIAQTFLYPLLLIYFVLVYRLFTRECPPVSKETPPLRA